MTPKTASNLPVQLTTFVGREREIAEVRKLICTSRLVTLTSAGGSGKTRLALQAATVMSCDFTDGVWFVELAALSEPQVVPALVARMLNVPSQPEQSSLAALLAHVGSRQMLLVLDNCEHLVAACAQLTEALLHAAPGLSILATSREPLALPGENLYRVPPLSLPPTADAARSNQPAGSTLSPQAAAAYDAVRLFDERARAVSPGFALTPGNTEAVVTICRRLDGIPLAIELASARAGVLTVHQIAAHLDDRLAFLISAHRTTPVPRHRTLREAIDWSYDLLSVEEQAVLRRLAVFVGGFTLETAEGFCGDDDIASRCTMEVIASLVNKSLVVATTLGVAEARYRLLESIRDYALEKLNQAAETAALRDRHLDLFVARAEEAAPRLGDAYQQLWLAWLESEHDNIRAALGWSLESGQIEKGLRICCAITRFWEIRGHVVEGLGWLERLLAREGEGVSLVMRATGHTFACFSHMLLGNAAECMAHGRTALELAEAAGEGNETTLGLALSALGTGTLMAGDARGAFSLFARLLPIYRRTGPPFHLGMALMTQGQVATIVGDVETARAVLGESLALAREMGDAFRVGHSWQALGFLAHAQHSYEEATTYYENAIVHLREIGAETDLASALTNLGYAAVHLRDFQRARTLFLESIAAHGAKHDVPGMAHALLGFAALAISSGLPGAGARLLAAATHLTGPRVMMKFQWPIASAECAHYLPIARSALGEAEFAAQEAAGQVMTIEQAVDYARRLLLGEPVQLTASAQTGGLTQRETEIAGLIAQGRSNGEIAGELVLSKRTVEKHVANLLSKLDMTQRAQIVRWALEHGLAASPQ